MFTALWFITACSHSRNITDNNSTETIVSRVNITHEVAAVKINTGKTKAGDLVDFAETLIGVPYQYGGTEPKTGFDCSGFIGYVFQHYDIKVPRTSVSFTNAGVTVKASDAKRGDLILFTGSDANSGKVGHMGIITDVRSDDIQFIHSFSIGKQQGGDDQLYEQVFPGKVCKGNQGILVGDMPLSVVLFSIFIKGLFSRLMKSSSR